MEKLKEEFRQERGFTLVELAIVLVIIGLLLAGALKGKDLMRSSYLQSFFKGKIQGVITATNLLQDKLGYLPDYTELGSSDLYNDDDDTCDAHDIPTGGTPQIYINNTNGGCIYYYGGVDFPDLDDDGLRYDDQFIYFKKFSGGRDNFSEAYITTGVALRARRNGSKICSDRDIGADICTYIDRLMDGTPNAAVGKVKGIKTSTTDITTKSAWYNNSEKLDGFLINE